MRSFLIAFGLSTLLVACSANTPADTFEFSNAPNGTLGLSQPSSSYQVTAKIKTSNILEVDLEFLYRGEDQSLPDADFVLLMHRSISTAPDYKGWHKKLKPKEVNKHSLQLFVDRSKLDEDNELVIRLETPYFNTSGQIDGIQRGGITLYVTESKGKLVLQTRAPSSIRYDEEQKKLGNQNPPPPPTQLPNPTHTPRIVPTSITNIDPTADARRLIVRATVIAQDNIDAQKAVSPLVSPIKK